VVVRVIALVLSVLMMAGAMGQVCASPDVTTVVDDAPELDPAVLPAPVDVPLPDPRKSVCIEAPLACARGRTHAVLVFRPPRLVASR
jgi:hypothetical protein